MDLSSTVALAAMTTLLFGSPGPAVLSVALSGARFGVSRSVPYLTGILIGLAGNLAIAGAGLAVVFSRYPSVGELFRYLSLGYVLYLATKLFRSAGAAGEERRPLTFVDGLVLNLINPKAYACALAILASFSDTGATYPQTFAWIFVVAMSVGIAVDVAWLTAGAYLARSRWGRGVKSSPRARRATNAAFAGLLVFAVFYSTFWL